MVALCEYMQNQVHLRADIIIYSYKADKKVLAPIVHVPVSELANKGE
jgi:hypothetical protein